MRTSEQRHPPSQPLVPSTFLERSALVHGSRTAVVDGARRFTYAELAERAGRLSGALIAAGVRPGDRVAVLAPNTHVALEAKFGVPDAGAVLVPLNIRLNPVELAYIVRHSGASVLLCDESLAPAARRLTEGDGPKPRIVVAGGADDEYEALLAQARPERRVATDEMALLSINYTSGTTGSPKGVMYHHRGAYLQAMAMAYHLRLDAATRYLWTLPMFHCHGWCFPWAVTLAGGVHLCLPQVDPAAVWELVREEGVTHLCAAPTVLTSIIHHDDAHEVGNPLTIATGGAPPSPAMLDRARSLGIDMVHLYGLTETFGPSVLCDWLPEWDDLPLDRQAERKARQGVGNVVSGPVRVLSGSGDPVPPDGATMGEVALKGNNVMLGYYEDPDATARAFTDDGWFKSGDLGVMHHDGTIELRDRAKDIIISGGENIASIEIEQALCSHPAVLEAAVVGMPDEKWGEVPAAFVDTKPGATVTEEELRRHLNERIARFKIPKRLQFGPLPKTSTGKIKKFALREQLEGGAA